MIITEPRTEQALAQALADYITARYPGVRFRMDAAGIRTSARQAADQARINPWRGWPDFDMPARVGEYNGLCIELKVAGTNLHCTRDGAKYRILDWKPTRAMWYQDPNDGKPYPTRISGKARSAPVFDTKVRRAGDWADAHLEEQAEQLAYLRACGRLAVFGVGLARCVDLVNGYLNGEPALIARGLEGTGQGDIL